MIALSASRRVGCLSGVNSARSKLCVADSLNGERFMMKIVYSVCLTLLSASLAIAEDSNVKQLNEVLRGELSAVETYQQALGKVKGQPEAARIEPMLRNHQEAVTKLQQEVQKAGGTPSTDSGAWGTWAETVMGSAKIFGDEAALKALKEGEQHGIKEYQETLQNRNVSQSAKDLITNQLLPAQQRHVQTLDELMERVG
jgi:uncharacterized protein (TIGR02284 family)